MFKQSVELRKEYMFESESVTQARLKVCLEVHKRINQYDNRDTHRTPEKSVDKDCGGECEENVSELGKKIASDFPATSTLSVPSSVC